MNSLNLELISEIKKVLDDYLIRRALLENILHSIGVRSNETPLEREMSQHNKNEILKKIEELEDEVAVKILRIQNEMQQ